MASSVIHMAVANEVNKVLKREPNKYLIGSIAPDISKEIGEKRSISHFQDYHGDLPHVDRFLNKYKDYLKDDFVMGYYVHLYTDYLWFKYFIPEVYDKDLIRTLDGKKIPMDEKLVYEYIYNDYTNLNWKVIDKYDLELDIFFNELPQFENIIEEIPMDKINLIVDKAGLIIKNSTQEKNYVFNLENVENFIKLSTELILANLKEIGKL